jgi:hypothetical protein
MNVPKSFSDSMPLQFLVAAYTKLVAATDPMQQAVRVLLELVLRLGGLEASRVRLAHLENFMYDPNATAEERDQRRQVLECFWRWSGNGSLSTATDITGQVLAVEATQLFLAQLARPWTAVYLVPRFFLGLENSAALGFIRGGGPPGTAYPLVIEQIAEGAERCCDRGPAFQKWLEPYRVLSTEEPFIQDPGLATYLENQAASAGLTWDIDLPSRTYCAFRLALTGNIAEAARHMGLPEEEVFENFLGLVSYVDARQYFALTPRECRRAYWAAEVKQFLDWHVAGHLFGASLQTVPAENGQDCASPTEELLLQSPQTE